MPRQAKQGCRVPRPRPRGDGYAGHAHPADAAPVIDFRRCPSIATEATGGADDVRRLREWPRLPSTRNVLRISMHVINSIQLLGPEFQWPLHHHLQAGALRDDDLVATGEERIDQAAGDSGKTADSRCRAWAPAGRTTDDAASGANDTALGDVAHILTLVAGLLDNALLALD